MIIGLVKKLGIVLALSCVSCAASMVSTSPYDRQVARVATLIADEVPAGESLNFFDLSRHIVTLSREYRLDPLLVLSIIKVESGFKSRVRSYAGAIGMMQLMPIVLREVGHHVSVQKREDLLDPYKNIHLGIHYFTFLLEKYRDDLRNALMAYNMGPTAVDYRLTRGGIPTGYYRKVMHCYETFHKKIQGLIEVT